MTETTYTFTIPGDPDETERLLDVLEEIGAAHGEVTFADAKAGVVGGTFTVEALDEAQASMAAWAVALEAAQGRPVYSLERVEVASIEDDENAPIVDLMAALKSSLDAPDRERDTETTGESRSTL